MKSKKCKACGILFAPSRPMQAACGIECSVAIVNRAKVIKLQKQKIQERKIHVQKLKEMRTLPQLKAAAQKDFNTFIRMRDEGKQCISCGKVLLAGALGGGYDCGHYRSVGSAPHLRYCETNAHGQCKHCNQYLAGNHVMYRIGLIERVGLPEVERIERDQTIRKYTKDGLTELARQYRQKAKDLQNQSSKGMQ